MSLPLVTGVPARFVAFFGYIEWGTCSTTAIVIEVLSTCFPRDVEHQAAQHLAAAQLVKRLVHI